jgi:hypothetical protein
VPEEWEKPERLISRPEKYSKKNDPDRPVGIIFCIKDALYSPKAKIRTLAAASQAGVALRGETEPSAVWRLAWNIYQT